VRVNLESITEDSEASEGYVSFKVAGKPRGKGRPRFRNAGRFTQVYTPQETLAYEKEVAEEYTRAGGYMFEGPVWVTVMMCFQIPKTATKKDQEAMRNYEIVPNCRPDVDNVLKAVLDGLNGVAYHDDTQVTVVLCERCYADEACIEVEVRELPGARFRRARC
jgi:Holliday junction resolvase RusA-like endonuclease